jgi:hypothetical protein
MNLSFRRSSLERGFEDVRGAHLGQCLAGLARQPVATIDALLAFGHGRRWLIGRWEEYRNILSIKGCWPPPVFAEVARLLGAHPDIAQLGENETAYAANLYNLHCQPMLDRGLIAQAKEPRYRPDVLRDADLANWTPDPALCRAALNDLVSEKLTVLRDLELKGRSEERGQKRDYLDQPLLLMEEDSSMKRLAGMTKDHTSDFIRDYKRLAEVLKRDASAAARGMLKAHGSHERKP